MKNKKKGFTLVETIVVLIVIGILLAIAAPSILGYVQKAEEEKILAKARNVLLVAKGEAVELYAHDELELLESDSNIAKAIMETSGVDGTLLEIYLNNAKDSSGNFLVMIDERYVYYDDTKKEFAFKEEQDSPVTSEDIKNDLISNKEILSIINEYFTSRTGNSIDSEGTNYGSEIMNKLKEKGYDTSTFSFRVYRSGNNNTITISSKKITTDMKSTNEKVEATQYHYGADKSYTSNPAIKTGNAPVDTKSIDGKDTIPYLKLDKMDWATKK